MWTVKSIKAAVDANDPLGLVRFLFNTEYPSFKKEAESALKTFPSEIMVNSLLEVSSEWIKTKKSIPEISIDIICNLDSIPIDRIIAALTVSGQERIAARILLRLIDSSQSKELKTQSEEALKEASTHTASRVRLAVAQALGYSKSQWGETLLLKLSGDKDVEVRKKVCYSLGLFNSDTAIQKLIHLQSDEEISVSLEAVKCLLSDVKDSFEIKLLKLKGMEKALINNFEPIRQEAAMMLVKFADDGLEFSNELEKLFVVMTEDKSEFIVNQAIRGLRLIKTSGAFTRLIYLAKTNAKLRKEAVFALVFHTEPSLSGSFILQVLDSQEQELILEIFNAIKDAVSENKNNKYNWSEESLRSRSLIAKATYFKDVLDEILQRITKMKSSDNPILSREATSTFSALSKFVELQNRPKVSKTPMGGFVEPLDGALSSKSTAEFPKSSKPITDKFESIIKRHDKPITQSVKFLAVHPTAIKQEELLSLLTYVYVENSEMLVRKDARERLNRAKSIYAAGAAAANTSIKQGAEIAILPTLPGISFNPRSIKIEWEDEWHVAEFRMKVDEKKPPAIFGSPIYGSVEFWLGPLCIGKAPIWLAVLTEETIGDEHNLPSESTTNMFHAIFPSYAREDSEFVEHLEKAYSLINLQYFRDVSTLRAGEQWEPRIKEFITQADIFQLCWSKAAALSRYVQDEYSYALYLNRTEFIKPIYWETSIPEVPEVLKHLHFQQWKN